MRTGMIIFIWPPEVVDWNASEEIIPDTASSETYCVLEVSNVPQCHDTAYHLD